MKSKEKKKLLCDNLSKLVSQLSEQGSNKLANHVAELLKIASKK